MFIETQGLWDDAVKQFWYYSTCWICAGQTNLNIETNATKIVQLTLLLFTIITSSPASALLWLFSVNFLTDRRLLNAYFGYNSSAD